MKQIQAHAKYDLVNHTISLLLNIRAYIYIVDSEIHQPENN